MSQGPETWDLNKEEIYKLSHDRSDYVAVTDDPISKYLKLSSVSQVMTQFSSESQRWNSPIKK